MKRTAEEVEHRLFLLSGLLFAGHGIGMWCYSPEQKLYYSTSLHWEELQMFLELSGILDKLTADNSENPLPMVYADELGLIWLGERVNGERFDGKEEGVMYVLCGPAFLRKNKKNEVLQKLEEMDLSVSLRLRCSRILSDVSVLETDAIRSIYRQLHFDIYDEYLTEGAFQIDSLHENSPEGTDQEWNRAEGKGQGEDYTQWKGSEWGMPERPERQGPGRKGLDKAQKAVPSEEGFIQSHPDAIEYEKMKKSETDLLNSVKTGVYDGTQSVQENPNRNEEHAYGGFVDYGLSDELRSLKDNMIVFQDKCCDAAIEGGLPLESAKAMQRDTIVKLEQCRTVGEAANVNWDAFLAYVQAVGKARNNAGNGISRPVQLTMDYIRRNYEKPLSLSELASVAGYSEYYLSRKFTKETGMKIQDYIRDVRMEMAKVMLISTKLSIFEIAERLQYKSRSHFDRTFTAQFGISPAGYRAGKGQTNKSSITTSL